MRWAGHRWVLTLVSGLLVGALVLPGTARADERTDARRHFRKGMQLIRDHAYEDGARHLEEAYALLPHPAVLYNIGKAYADAGQLEVAITWLVQYLDSNPKDADEVETYVEGLEDALERARLAAEEEDEAKHTPLPAETVGGEVRLAKAELTTLRRSADRLTAVAEATGSQSLAEEAAALEAVAERLATGAPAETGSETPPPTEGGETPDGAETLPPPKDETPPPTDTEPGTPEVTPPAPALAARASTEGLYEAEVVSASRVAESPLEAPNSTVVVTAQDIRLSGLTSLPELLRRAAGVEVMTLSPGDTEVGIRGLNQRLSNKVLVLVDGRSVYLDFLGATLWQSLPVPLERIDRIEIIRGPASAVYGADAFSGIVNILTVPAGSGGSHVQLGAGLHGSLRAEASTAGRSPQGVAWSFSGGHDLRPQSTIAVDPSRVDVVAYGDDPSVGLRRSWFSGELAYRPAEDWRIRAGTAVGAGDLSFQGIARLREMRAEDLVSAQTHLTLDAPFGLSFRTYWNAFRTDVGSAVATPGAIPVVDEDLKSHVVDAELSWQDRLEFLAYHDVAAGVGYRLKLIDWEWLDDSHREDHWSVYLQDRITFLEIFRFTASARLDQHPLLDGPQLSPRASLVVRPSQGLAFRATVGSAFRSPTFLESYLSFENPTPLRGITALGLGNTELKPERITSAELGVTGEVQDALSFEANGYFNLIDDQILLSRITPYSLANWPGYDSDVAAFPVGELSFSNEDATFRQLGMDLGVRVFPVQGLDVYANYSLHLTQPVDASIDLGGREADQRTSLHKVNTGVQWRGPFGVLLSVDAHWVSEQVWVEQVTDAVSGVRFETFDLPAYFLVDSRLGWRGLDDRLDVGIVATNLFDQWHREHPFGQRLRRRVLFTTTWRF